LSSVPDPSPRAADLLEARAWLESARSRCQDVSTARFLELIIDKVEHNIGQAETPRPERPAGRATVSRPPTGRPATNSGMS